MDDIKVSVFASTDVGMQRSGNEDSFLVADLTTGNTGLGPDMSTHRVGERGSLMIVSDGMGGAAAGEIASELAVTTICESLMQKAPGGDVTERLRLATEAANERVWNHSLQNPELAGMGATVTAVLVQGTVANIAQVGDSRAYLIRGERVKQITKDQSLAQMLVDSGAIRPDQIHSVPQNVIMQALGTQPSVKVAMTTVQLCRNDCLLICSDGLSNKIDPDDLRRAIEESEDLMSACHRLVRLANERGGEDNITVIIAQFDGEALISAGESQSVSASLHPLDQDYVSDGASAAPTFSAPVAQAKDNGITQMLTAVIPAPSEESSEEAPPATASSEDENTLPSPIQTVPDASATVLSQEFLQAEMKPAARGASLEKKSYVGIIIFTLVSLILIAMTMYFFYGHYLKSRQQQPQNSEPSSTDEK
ncbi:MAG TPA: protein phosphatase 2C domain-containing protein [Blastocatellia bacterium]|jgi:protein phosphatase|nr:protein phosphatase 2C domain-containing protein [Blastocatellia bacterium]